MKKKVILSFILLVAVVFIISLISFATFIAKTIGSEAVYEYCQNNTSANAATFVRYQVNSDPAYAFWIAEDSASNFQEIFIFKKERFGLLDDLDRFSLIHHSTSGTEADISSIMFIPHDDRNKKKSTNLLVFYSSNKDKITSYTITYYENGDECTRKGTLAKEEAFLVSISDLGVKDGIAKKFIQADFYNDEGELVETRTQ